MSVRPCGNRRSAAGPRFRWNRGTSPRRRYAAVEAGRRNPGMRPNRVDVGRLRRNATRRLSALVELLVGTTRPHGRALRTIIDASLDPRFVAVTAARDGSLREEHRVMSGRDHSLPRTHPHTLPRGVDSLLSLGRYDDGLGSMVATAKYEAWPMPLEILGRRLGVEVAATIDWRSGARCMKRLPVVVPVPTCGWRRWHRGIDHTQVIATGVARVLRVPIRRVLRCRWAPPQVELDRFARRRPGHRFQRRRLVGMRLQSVETVVLVDDVCTTGETLAAVASLLRAHGVDTVHAAVVARGGG